MKRILALFLAVILSISGVAPVYAEEQASDFRMANEEDLLDSALEEALEEEIRQSEESFEIRPAHSRDEIEAAEQEREKSVSELGYVPGEILVVYKDTVSVGVIEETVQNLDGFVKDSFESEETTLAVVNISQETTVGTAIEEYEADPNVAYAEPNYILFPLEEEEILEETDYLAAIQAEEAFALLTDAGSAVDVGIIDLGFDPDNTALAGKVSSESVRVLNSAGETAALTADGGMHGTNVAAILAAASGPALREMILVDAGAGDSSGRYLTVDSVIGAIYYLIPRVRIMNMSFGTEGSSMALQEAVNTAYQNGTVMICAAGNTEEGSFTYPSAYDKTISVMASLPDGGRWEQSGSGEIAAPGTGILCADGNRNSGTSLSAAMVSAAAAMLLCASLNLSFAQIREILLSTADSSGGAPVLQMADALRSLSSLQPGKENLSEAEADLSAVQNHPYVPDWADRILLFCSGLRLQKDIDYKVIEDSQQVDTDGEKVRVSVTFEGLGDYTGSITAETEMNKTNLEDCRYSLHGTYAPVSGSSAKPEIVLTYEEPENHLTAYTLKEGTDYSLEYGANDIPGENAGLIRINGLGFFCGTKEVYFDILSEDEVITSVPVGDNMDCKALADGTLVFEGSGDMLHSVTLPIVDSDGNTLDIQKVVIGEGITSLCPCAFMEYEQLREVVLPDSLKRIDYYAFYGCKKLTSIELPPDLESIGWQAFAYAGLKNVVIPKNVVLGQEVFYCCRDLTGVMLPDHLKTIEMGLFQFCESLTEVTLPESITSIGRYAFDYCTALKKIEIPESVTEIQEFAFAYCDSLKSVLIPVSVKTIGNRAFSSVMNVLYAGNREQWEEIEIGEEAFSQDVKIRFSEEPMISGTCGENLTWTLEEGLLRVSGTGEMSDFRMIMSVSGLEFETPWGQDIRKIILEEGVTGIGTGAFYNCGELTEVSLPESLKKIGEKAFMGCRKMNEIHLPEGLETIEAGALSQCTELETVRIPDTVTRIGAGAFEQCSALTSVTLPKNLDRIEYDVFTRCGLTQIELPDTVAVLDGDAFSYCDNLISAVLPEGLLSIGNYAFFGCGKLTTLKIPETVQQIGDSAVSYTGLTALVLPDSVASIGNMAFCGCRSMASVRLPAGLTKIPDGVFMQCSALQEINLPEKVTEIGQEAFRSCLGLKKIVLPEGVARIGKRAFYECKALSEIEFPMTLQLPGEEAFRQCSLTEVTLPETACITEENKTDFFDEGVILHLILFENRCGENAFWQLEEEGNLKIWGTGSVEAFSEDRYLFYDIADQIKAVTLQEGITGTGKAAFAGLKNLETVFLPNTLEIIDDSAFAYCEKLENVTIPGAVQKIGIKAFYGCSALQKIELTELKREIQLRQVQAHAFAWCENLRNINLGAAISLKSIGTGAFNHCTSLETPDAFTNSLETIGDYAFYGCSSLPGMSCSNVRSIGKAAFGYCTSLEYYGQSNALEKLGEMAFIGCTRLKSAMVMVNDSPLAEIGAYAFYNCKNLKNFYISPKLKTIGDYAFYGSGITGGIMGDQDRIILKSNLLSVGKFAFANCENLQLVIFKNPDTKIGAYAFYKDPVLEKVQLPNNLSFLQDGTFAFCESLKSPKASETIDQGLYVFVDTSSQTDVSAYENVPAGQISMAEGTAATLQGISDTKAEVISSCDAVASVLPFSTGKYKVQANAPGTATIVYKGSNGRTARWTVRVNPPLEADLEGLYKETGTAQSSGYGNCKHTSYRTQVVRKATCSAAGLESRVCRTCGRTIQSTVIPSASRIWLAATSFTYNGGIRKPSVTVRDSNGRTISTDNYTITYSNANSKTVGYYKVTVRFRGTRYSGSKTLSYRIVKAVNTITNVTSSKILKYTTLKSRNVVFAIAATVKESARKTFSLSSISTKAKPYITVSSSGKVTVKKGIPKGTYTLKVKITAAATANYKSKSVTKSIKITIC